MDSIVFYRSWIETIDAMPIDDAAKFDAVKEILNYGTTQEDTGHWAVKMAKIQIDKNIQRRMNGAKGGAPRTKTQPNVTKRNQNITKRNQNITKRNQTQPNTEKAQPNVNVNDNVNVNVNDNDNDNVSDVQISKKFTPPTIEEVKVYVEKNNYHVDAETFVNYYQSIGWVRGKTKMKDWRAAVRTWERKEKKYAKKENYGIETERKIISSFENVDETNI